LVIEREEAQNVGMDILFWLMDHHHQEYLTNELNEYLLNKNPKVLNLLFDRSLQWLSECFNYWYTIMDPKGWVIWRCFSKT
jgi:hypothetical protein